MATTTTNFGWDIPQSTDLVKDGATAIAALGQDIDTALVDLKGGTTGQVLAKASSTDLDFSWVAQDDSNAIQNAIIDAKGDLIAATAADTPARLAVGTNGQVLTADSTAATGIKWADAASGGMTLISTTTLSGASTTINSFGGYKNLLVLVYGATNASANGYAKIDPNGSTNITDLNVFGGTSGGGKSYTTAIGTTIYMNYNTDALRTDANNSYSLQILDYASTANYKPVYFTADFLNSSSARVNETQTGTIRTTSAITSLVITNPGGNWSTGTVLVYGVK